MFWSRTRNLTREGRLRLGRLRGHHDVAAGRGQLEAAHAADAPGPAGDDGDAALEVEAATEQLGAHVRDILHTGEAHG